MNRRLLILLPLLAAAACSGSPSSPSLPGAPYSQVDLLVGTGAVAVSGNRVTVGYAGWLYDPARPDGKGTQFDASSGFAFQLGAGQVIRGWDQGVAGMRIGGQRRLVIPPELAYGSSGRGPIPPNATLVFDVALLGIQ